MSWKKPEAAKKGFWIPNEKTKNGKHNNSFKSDLQSSLGGNTGKKGLQVGSYTINWGGAGKPYRNIEKVKKKKKQGKHADKKKQTTTRIQAEFFKKKLQANAGGRQKTGEKFVER